MPIPTPSLIPPRQSSSSEHGQDGEDRRQTPNRRSFRVFLSDGELVIQALLKSALHRFVLTGKLRQGSVVRVEDYEVQHAKRMGGKTGEVIYLAVGWFESVERKKTTSQAVEKNRTDKDIQQRKRKMVSEALEGDHKVEPKRVKFDLSGDKDKRTTSSADDFDDDDELYDFMSQAIDPMIGKEPQKLEDSFGMGPESFSELTEYIEKEGLRDKERKFEAEDLTAPLPSSHSAVRADSQPEGWKGIQGHGTFFSSQPLRPIERSLNVLSLSELVYPYKPLPKRNYLCDVFAVISWISPTVVKRQHMPPKRDLRILDPTIEQRKPRGVQVSVFADAEGFQPRVGTIALFRSLKTHEWDGVSLNAYEKDCLAREWFVSDPEKLKGYDVPAMQEWWERREKEGKGHDSQNNTPGTSLATVLE